MPSNNPETRAAFWIEVSAHGHPPYQVAVREPGDVRIVLRTREGEDIRLIGDAWDRDTGLWLYADNELVWHTRRKDKTPPTPRKDNENA